MHFSPIIYVLIPVLCFLDLALAQSQCLQTVNYDNLKVGASHANFEASGNVAYNVAAYTLTGTPSYVS